jgi:hypothetical protein
MALGGFIDDKVELFSPLSREECVKRLKEAADRGGPISGGRSVRGYPSATRLRAVVRIWYANPLQTILRAKSEEVPSGTRIHCSFGLGLFTKISLSIWFVGVAVMGLAGTVTFALSPANDASLSGYGSVIFLLFTALILAFGVGFVSFGRWLARNEQPGLKEFICNTLNASEALPSSK